MAYKPWDKTLEKELIQLAVRACELAGDEFLIIGKWEIAISANNRVAISEFATPGHGKIVFSNYPGVKKIVNRRLCMFEVLPLLRAHPPLVLDQMAKI